MLKELPIYLSVRERKHKNKIFIGQEKTHTKIVYQVEIGKKRIQKLDF